MSTIVDLPLPISVNRVWRVGRGGRVHKCPRYIAWQRAAGWELVLQKPKPIAGPVIVTIDVGKPDRRNRDIDNLNKAVLDLLQTHRVFADDALVMSITSRWCDAVIAGRIVVTVGAAH